MHPRWRPGRRLAAAPSLTQQVALLSLIPIVALGFVLARELQARIVARALADAGQSAQLIAHIKRIGATKLELPIVDDSGVWILTVERMGIQDDANLK